MAAQGGAVPASRPEIGDTLIVIHDFLARSSDELSLSKGDRVELIERDDEFGDGWFLGRHLTTNNTGLFPEVYTRPAPKNVPILASSRPPSSQIEATNNVNASKPVDAQAKPSVQPSPPTVTAPVQVAEPVTAFPFQPMKSEGLTPSPSLTTNGSSAPVSSRAQSQTQDSQVLNDTLNVINEHITHLRSSPSSGGLQIPSASNDSGSEYSMPLDSRLSYIQGEETDEEEGGDQDHSRSEVESWNADEVAEYLFTSGVEKQHCEVFRDQEISGEVLLGMDQSSLFIKAFDLGSVGRRLKTWHKIKALQDEVNHNNGISTQRSTQTWTSENDSEDVKGTRSWTNTATTSISNRPISSSQPRRLSTTQMSTAGHTALRSPLSSTGLQDSPTRAHHFKRPSAASIRDLHHSRRHSSTDYRAPAPPVTGAFHGTTPPVPNTDGFMSSPAVAHKKQASFDRNWTLGNAFGQSASVPLSPADMTDAISGSDPNLQDSAVDLDRGYFSGTDTDPRRQSILRRRDGTSNPRTSSYAEEQRIRTATAISRHSRFGSVDSFREPPLSPAIQKYYGMQSTVHKRTASANTIESVRPPPPNQDGSPAPIVTRIDTSLNPTRSPASPSAAGKAGFGPDWLSSVVNKPLGKTRPGKRAISDKVTTYRSKDMTADAGLDSPVPPASSTASMSGEASLDLESPGTGKSFNSTPTNKNNKRKGKKHTSAYTRGLQMISPSEAIVGADYYGWMKKRSSSLMTTWKSRFFVLKGRRLAYYYSEDDDQEKGLIDISFHRVLPADNERLTGLHATITGMATGPSLPLVGGEFAGVVDKPHEPVFIFKLVPPRAGLSRAVNFTKPTVHYFALPNLPQGRLWMAALMKATIDRDDTKPITTTYQQKTISLTKAKQMRHRPPALMNLEETAEDEQRAEAAKLSNGLGLFGESDSGVSGVDKLGGGVVSKDNGLSLGHLGNNTNLTVPPPPSA